MREIKFRAWEAIENKMYNNVQYGIDRGIWINFGTLLEIHDYVLMQYTGLKDKNGKEMFESDRVKANDVYGVYEGHIVWWEDRWALTYIGQDGVTPQFQSLMTVRNPEVIGNTFEK